MKTLVDIQDNKELIDQVQWDMKPREKMKRTGKETPEEMKEIENQLHARVGFYFYVEVRFQQVSLYLYENYPDGSGKFVAEIVEIPEQMLHDAIEQAGGKPGADGKYPITEAIKSWLKERLPA